MSVVKPITLLFVYFLIAIQGCPGLDYLNKRDFVSERSQDQLRKTMPEWAVQVAIALGAVNRTLRLPLVEKTEWMQKPFRIAQTWNLYRDGPGRINRMEIYLDGELVHRTADSEHDWLTPQLRSRRLRPVVESTARQKKSKNYRGLGRFIKNRALEDFPDTESIEIRAVWERYPEGDPSIRHRIVMDSPDWKPVVK